MMFVAVAVSAGALADFLALSERVAKMERLLTKHKDQADLCATTARLLYRPHVSKAEEDATRKKLDALSRYHAALSQAYEHAAWRPWVSVEEGTPP